MAAALKNGTGIGMTSQRTRARMVERLREQGIRDQRVLNAMGSVPRQARMALGLACAMSGSSGTGAGRGADDMR